MKDRDDYSDIIRLPHPTSAKHPRMSSYDRAAQFSPFAALKGYDEGLIETARLTHDRISLDEESEAKINETLLLLQERASRHPPIRVTFFRPDARKAGGEYVTVEGELRRFDGPHRKLCLSEEDIPFEDIFFVEII